MNVDVEAEITTVIKARFVGRVHTQDTVLLEEQHSIKMQMNTTVSVRSVNEW